jgi:hypothetical protein
MEFASVEGRAVVAAFDGGTIKSDAGALLLGSTDRAIGLVERFSGCFADQRRADLVEHDIATLVMQRVFGIALGYEDLVDHDQLRHDPVMAVLAGKLAATRSGCAPLAGKSTLNRLELSSPEPSRYHKISHDADAIEALCSSICSSTPIASRRHRSRSTWMPPTTRCTAIRRVASFTATTIATATCRSTFSAAATC